ncbi:MAG TPA: lanthionine synthetase LanC family protein [Thermoanaerobaculia bacterium]|nr:lanthionine synthetase LanC family protein [Thermoanaerobaculia bacterium]
MDAERQQYLAVADALGARLCRDAVWDGRRANWLGDSMELVDGAWQVAHRSFGPDLYGGTSGIALFLARLYKATGEPLFRRTALGALEQTLSRLDKLVPPFRIGVYSGLTGVAYALAQCAILLGEDRFRDAAAQAAGDLLADEIRPEALDVVAGSAGAIPVLLGLSNLLGNGDLPDLARKHGENLLATARRQGDACSWATLPAEGAALPDLTGFSHGTAGIGWGLLELAKATGEERYGEAAEGAFRYERRFFSPQHGNWPDFRGSQPGYSLAWCHGAPGIALSRARAFRLTGSEEAKREAAVAIQTTEMGVRQSLGYGAAADFSLCHGLAGNAECAAVSARILGNGAGTGAERDLARFGIERYHNDRAPWPCGVPGGGENPSLMLGLAGIGHFYLRLALPDAVPSVLMIVPEEAAAGAGEETRR